MIWLGLIFLVIGCFINFMIIDEAPRIFVGTVIAILGALLIMEGCNKRFPTAIDVYKNKTTLEISYKNGVPIDTIIVFKDKEK